LRNTLPILPILVSLLLAACPGSAPGHSPDGGPDSEAGPDGDAAQNHDAELPDAQSPACDGSAECPAGSRCEEGLCLTGWTVTTLAENQSRSCWPVDPLPFAVRPEGGVLVAGAFQGELDFDPGPGVAIHSSQDAMAGFIIALDSNGEYIDTHLLPGGGPDEGLESLCTIATDPEGRVYLAGVAQQGTIDVDPGPAVHELTVLPDLPGSGSNRTPFVVRLTPDMNLEWVDEFFGVVDFETMMGLAEIVSTGDGGAILTGFYNRLFWEETPGNYEVIQAMGIAAFVRRILPDGQHAWTAGQRTGDFDALIVPRGLAFHPDGRILSAGHQWTYASVDFDPGPTDDWRSEPGAFIWQLAGDGTYLDTADRTCVGTLALHPAAGGGAVLIGGSLRGEMDLDPGPGIDTHTTPADEFDGCAVLLEPTLDARWPWTSGQPGNDYVTAVTADEQGTVYLAVWLEGPSLIIALDANGIEQWRRDFPGWVQRMTTAAGHLYLGGIFSQEGDFNPGPGTDHRIPTDQWDTFITRLTLQGTY
jgi:hypothetical protein